MTDRSPDARVDEVWQEAGAAAFVALLTWLLLGATSREAAGGAVFFGMVRIGWWIIRGDPEEAAKTSVESIPETSLNEKGATVAPVNPSNH